MVGVKPAWLKLIAALAVSCVLLSAAYADDTPRAILQSAIKAHGGEENLAKTLTGTLLAKGTFSLRDVQSSISWEETFELPRRYRRSIKGQGMGQNFSMEYAITDGSGWIRQNGAETKDYKGEKLPLSRSWTATFALLPSYMKDGYKLEAGGKEKVNGKEAVGVRVSDEGGEGEAVFFFDSQSRLLVKRSGRMDFPKSGQTGDGELFYSDYKKVSGVQYPHRIVSYFEGKKISEMEITRIEFVKKLDDRLFEKP